MNLRNLHLAAGLALAGVLAMLVAAFLVRGQIGWAGWVIGAAGCGALGALSWFWRLAMAGADAGKDSPQALLDQLELEAERVRRARDKLGRQLVTHHAWMEFPDWEGARTDDPDQAAEFAEKDAEVHELMKREAEVLFNKLVGNEYLVDGEIQRRMIGDDVLALITAVARVYQPDSEKPLLETSISQLLRAVNRASLQLLVQLEQLPLNVKDYNLRETYEYIRAGVRYYGYYKKALPYWNYVRPVYQIGRLAIGVNPITVGIGWGLSEVVKQGATHYANAYALALFHDSLRIVASESAGIFGGDYRHRDPGWIYGAELTELVSSFPLARDTLASAMNQVSGLPLRSEYDRVFLYRCLSERRSANPEKSPGVLTLPVDERRVVAEQLEAMFKTSIHGREPKAVGEWRAGVESRLGVKLKLDLDGGAVSSAPEGVAEAVGIEVMRSLASFLVEVKHREPAALADLLNATRSARAQPEAVRRTSLDAVSADPPMIFGYPDIEPASDEFDCYLDDLFSLEATQPVFSERGEEALREVSTYFRRDWTKSRRRFLEVCRRELCVAFGSDAPSPRVRGPVARAILSALSGSGRPHFIYPGAEPVTAGSDGRSETPDFYLLGMPGDRLSLVAVSHSDAAHVAETVWSAAPGTARVTRRSSRLGDSIQIDGGRWEGTFQPGGAVDGDPAITVPGRPLARFGKYFAALLGVTQKR